MSNTANTKAAAFAWERILTYLASGNNVDEAVKAANEDMRNNRATFTPDEYTEWYFVGDGTVKLR